MLKIPAEDREMLKCFVKNYDEDIGQSLSEVEAKRVIDTGLIEMFTPEYFMGIPFSLFEYNNKHFHNSNGLLITENGYFITCRHCATELKGKKILDHRGNIYQIEGVCAWSKNTDTALLKAEIDGARTPLVYRFSDNSRVGKSVVMIARRNGQMRVRGTSVLEILRPSNSCGDNEYRAPCVLLPHGILAGDSGGIVVDMEGGLHSVSMASIADDNGVETNSLSIPWPTVMEFIRFILK